MLPFIPQSLSELQQRYNAAISKPVNAVYASSHPDESPGNKREHVFDFDDGVRLIISRDFAGNDEMFHVSGSVEECIWKGLFDKTLIHHMKQRFQELSGYGIPAAHTFVITGKGIPHWLFKSATLINYCMKNKDLIEKLKTFPEDMEVCIYDWCRSQKEADGEASCTGIYEQFEVSMMNDEDIIFEDEEELQKWIALGFKNKYIELEDAVWEGAEMWKQEYDNCRQLLNELMQLKVIKDRAGKTDDYLKRQPIAWNAAKEFLKKYQHS